MNILDSNLDGCCVRGLPIGKPFRARFEVPKDYEATFTDTVDVFVLLRYKDMQGGEIIDLVNELERQDTPLEMKENTLKRRILNRQNIIKEETEKDICEYEEDAYIETVTIEDLLELHVESVTGKSFYVNPDSGKTFNESLEPDAADVILDTGQVQTEMNGNCGVEEGLNEEDLSGTDKIIEALLSRKSVDETSENETSEPEHDLKNTDVNLPTLAEAKENISEKENPTEEEKLRKPHKRKGIEESEDTQRAKLKKIEEEEIGVLRRKSHRLRSTGYRLDYEAMEKSSGGAANSDNDDTDSYELDNAGDNSENYAPNTVIKKSIREKRTKKSTNGKRNSVSKSIDNGADAVEPPQNNKARPKSFRQKQRKGKCEDKDTDNHITCEDGKTADISSVQGENELGKKDQSGSVTDEIVNLNEALKDSLDESDSGPVTVKKKTKPRKKVNKTGVETELDETKDKNHSSTKLEVKDKAKSQDKDSNKTDDVREKTKKRKKPRESNASDSQVEKTEDDDSSQIDSDPELQGLGRYQRKLVILRRKKMLEQQTKQATRIKIKLNEHPEKWKTYVMDSFMRKDRGKARYEVAVEMYVCLVCDKYKAESKESMENHIEMHVNGDLQCNQCTHVAVTNFELQKHKRDVHKKNIWMCDLCGFEAIGKEGLKDHLGKVHNDPQYSCKLCLKKDKKFASVTLHEYKKHIRSAHPESMFQCEGCKRLFAQQHKLENHKKIGCEGVGQKSVSCEKCGKVFSSQDSVKRHIMRVHNKERSFQCPYCPFTAARQTNLTSHLNVHEGRYI